MNGYEFTRFEAYFASKAKAQAYDADTVRFKIEYNNTGWDIRAEADYEDAKFWFLETTMSCNKSEAVNWMKYYMANAIAYGIQTKNRDWMTKFMAAYDIFHELVPETSGSAEFMRFNQNC